MWSHISIPQSDRSPVEIQRQVCVVLSKSREESRCQRGGELQILVCKQEWSYTGVQSNEIISHKDMNTVHVELHKVGNRNCVFIHPQVKQLKL